MTDTNIPPGEAAVDEVIAIVGDCYRRGVKPEMIPTVVEASARLLGAMLIAEAIRTAQKPLVVPFLRDEMVGC